MDDVPAGPASPELRRPSLSVVVPVRNGGRDFERCLLRLRDSFLTDYELIVIDDGSTDDSAGLAARAGATVYRHPTPQGPAAARNWGARVARAPLDLLSRRRRGRSSPHTGPGTGPLRDRPRPVGAFSARTTPARPRPGSSASIATCSIISSTSRELSSRESGRPTPSGPAADSSAATSSSPSAALTPASIPGQPSRTSSWVIA